jgi:hypothetical protein
MFWCVFERADVLAYVLFHFVTGYDRFSGSEEREPVLACRFLSKGARRWFQFLPLFVLKTLDVFIHVPFATVTNIEEYKSLLGSKNRMFSYANSCSLAVRSQERERI